MTGDQKTPGRNRWLSVRVTLVLLVGIVVFHAIALSVYTARLLGPSAARLSQDSEEIVTQLELLNGIALRIDEILAASRARLAGGLQEIPDDLDPTEQHYQISTSLRAATELSRIPLDMRLALASAAEHESALMNALDRSRRLIVLGDYPEAEAELARAETLHGRFTAEVGRIESLGLKNLADKQDGLIDLTARLRRWAPVWIGVALLLGMLTFLVTHLRIYRPLKILDDGLRRVAGGDLGQTLPIQGGDEMGRLNQQFNRTLAILRRSAEDQEQQARSIRNRLGLVLEESSHEIYLLHGETAGLLEVNHCARENLGYSLAELENFTFADLVDDTPDILEESVFAPLRRGEIEVAHRECTNRRRDGTTYPLEIRVHYSSAQDPPVFLVMGLDMTEVRRQEAQLQQAQKMEAVGNLTGGIAHDFNNLLTVIVGNLDMITDDEGLDTGARAMAGEAQKAAGRGAALTRQLLAFARKQPLEPKGLDLNRLVSGMNEMLRRTLEEGLDIQVVLAAGLWVCEADPRQLENALLNLAINARDAMEGRGTLTIETANVRLDEEYASVHQDVVPGQYVMLAVTDTGKGIPEDDIPQVFEPFFTTKPRGKGSGLGLSMIYGFVKQSRGHIKIYSEPGQGTTVKIYLPKSAAHAAPGELTRAAESEPRGAGQMILVVEDDPGVRSLILRQLKDIGYRVLEASEGETALEIISSACDIDLILTDVVLPGKQNGRELADRAQEIREGIPVLFMSGYTENAIVHQGRLDTGVALLQKPFRRALLARKVAAVLAAQK